jgi:hypothetical protein
MDYKSGEIVAVKVIRNKKRFHQQASWRVLWHVRRQVTVSLGSQALIEVKLLAHVRERDAEDTANVIHMKVGPHCH